MSGFATIDSAVEAVKLGARDYLTNAAPVVRVREDVPLPEIDDRIPSEPRDPAALVELSQRWALDSALNRLLASLKDLADS